MDENLVNRLRSLAGMIPQKHKLPSGADTVICSLEAFMQITELAKETADALEERQSENETTYIVVAKGKGALRMLECRRCGKRGWFGADTPKYCIECGAKVNLLEEET